MNLIKGNITEPKRIDYKEATHRILTSEREFFDSLQFLIPC